MTLQRGSTFMNQLFRCNLLSEFGYLFNLVQKHIVVNTLLTLLPSDEDDPRIKIAYEFKQSKLFGQVISDTIVSF